MVKTRQRRMPSLRAIAEHWHSRIEEHPELWPSYKGHWIGLGEPFCFRCGWLTPGEDPRWKRAGRYLDRAHVIDHAADGLDDVQNLIPLCQLCHSEQPEFVSGEEQEALRWFTTEFRRPHAHWWQSWTDELLADVPGQNLRSVYLTFLDRFASRF